MVICKLHAKDTKIIREVNKNQKKIRSAITSGQPVNEAFRATGSFLPPAGTNPDVTRLQPGSTCRQYAGNKGG